MSPGNPVQERAVAGGIDLARLPAHIAVIMDGNGRWAESRNQHRVFGHEQGYRALRNAVLTSGELGLGYLTAYAFSAENWRRPQAEVDALMELIAYAAQEELAGVKENNVQVRLTGRVDDIPEPTRSSLRTLESETASNTGVTLVLAVNYGGRREIVDACAALMRDGADPESLTEEHLAAQMYCPDIPDPDLMIRTAGEMRWSNFLIWEAAYAELWVTQKNWPEFEESDLFEAVLHYQNRTRKFGGLATTP